MKTNKLFGGLLALMMLGGTAAMTSCTDKGEESYSVAVVASFEGSNFLNADKYWIGQKGENGVENAYGGVDYACKLYDGLFAINTTYSYYEAYGMESWMGFAVSGRTETTFADATMTTDQFNNVVGGGANGTKNFAVVFDDGAKLSVAQTDNVSANTKGVKIYGLYFTNSAYVKHVVTNGNAYAKKFENGDYLKVTITADNGKSVEFYPVDYREGKTILVDKWTPLDLTSLGYVKSLTFSFDGTDKGDWGLNTPKYICIDDLTYLLEK